MNDVTFGISAYLLPPHLPAQLQAAGYTQAELHLHATPDRYAMHEAVSRFAVAVSRLHQHALALAAVRLPTDDAWDIALAEEGESRSNLAALAYLLEAAAQFAPRAVCLRPAGRYAGDAARLDRLQRALQLLDRVAVSANTTLCLEVATPQELAAALALRRGLFATRICPVVDAGDDALCTAFAALPADTVGAVRLTHADTPCAAVSTLYAGLGAAGYDGPLLVEVPLVGVPLGGVPLVEVPALVGDPPLPPLISPRGGAPL